jgi:hypothetical protein
LSQLSCARLDRRISTTSLPSCQARTIDGISSGGSWRSASMTTTASPPAWSSPALIATSLPKLRDRSMTATRESLRFSPVSSASDASRLPSFT